MRWGLLVVAACGAAHPARFPSVKTGLAPAPIALTRSPAARPIADGQLAFDRSWGDDRLKQAGVMAVAISADGKRGASASSGGRFVVWDLGTGQAIARIESGQGNVFALALSANGDRAATGGQDGTVRVFDAATGAQLGSFAGSSKELPKRLRFAADGARVVIDWNDAVRGIDTAGKLLWEWPVDRYAKLSVAPDGRHALARTEEGLHAEIVGDVSEEVATSIGARWFDLDTKTSKLLAGVQDLTLSTDGKLVVARGDRLTVIDPESGEVVRDLGPAGPLGDLVATDGAVLVARDYDATTLIDLTTGQTRWRTVYDGGGRPATPLLAGNDVVDWVGVKSTDVTPHSAEPGPLVVRAVTDGREVFRSTSPWGSVLAAAGAKIFFVDGQSQLQVVDLAAPGERLPAFGHAAPIASILPAGDAVLTFGDDGTVWRWGEDTARRFADPAQPGTIRGTAAIPGGRVGAVEEVDFDRFDALVWDVGSGALLTDIPIGKSIGGAILPTGDVMFGDVDGRHTRIDLATGRWLEPWAPWHRRDGNESSILDDAVARMAFAGDRAYTSGADFTLDEWDARAGRRLGTWPLHPSLVTVLALDGTSVLVGHEDGFLGLFDPKTHTETPVTGPVGRIEALAVRADGRFAAGSADGRVTLFDPGGHALGQAQLPPDDVATALAFTADRLGSAGTAASCIDSRWPRDSASRPKAVAFRGV